MKGVVVEAPGASLSLDEVAAATGGVLDRDTLAGAPPPRAEGVAIDSRAVRAHELFFAIAGPRHDGHEFLAEAAERGAAAAVVHRDVGKPPRLALVRVADTTRALQDLARHVRRGVAVPVVAITGSMGKTTTKDMTATLLGTRGPVLKTEGNLNNQFGLPLTLLRFRPEHTAAVLEMGMSAAGELRLLTGIARPDVAVITNVAPVHLAFFDSVDDIARAKAEILEGLAPEGTAALNGDDARVRALGENRRGRVIYFGRDRRFEVSAENWRGTAFGMRFDLVLGGRTFDLATPLAGPHFVNSILAATAAAHALGIPGEAIVDAATRFEAAPHRGRVVRLAAGVTLIDDCYNSSPQALEAAVGTLQMAGGRRRVAFVGDMLELGHDAARIHHDLGEKLRGRVDVLVAVGPLARELAAGAGQATHIFPDSTSAASASSSLVERGDAVLVKGSRGVAMERIVDALAVCFGKEDE